MSTLLNIAFALIFVASARGTNAAELLEVRSYPAKPVRIGTGAAGNAIDISARLLAQQLSEKWGKQVIIENRAGQAMLSAEITAKAAPDGYTLCMGEFSSFAAAPNMQKQLAY
ncbi:tripartite tricarboxylate transporter substrate-binding protein, partial [Craterilacuibacter sp.]|uniref:tripartite tricarboxylate transporter substrate-binding protein n=1 Tax=Craterilacuibacter sp. TaxID=2870909 RepID=UPI003F3E99D3